jgi:hypothetical protein
VKEMLAVLERKMAVAAVVAVKAAQVRRLPTLPTPQVMVEVQELLYQ